MIHSIVSTSSFSLVSRMRLCLSAVLLLLAGCSVLPDSETLVFYQLPAASTPPAAQQAPTTQSLPSVLRIATPYGDRAVDSTRILVEPETNRISAYKGARWSDAAPSLLRDRLVEAFRARGVFRSVVADSGNLMADLELTSELSQFQVTYREGSPVVVVVLDATLIEMASSHIIASRRFQIEQAVRGKEVPEVVQAFGLAVEGLAAQLIDWSQQQARTVKAVQAKQ